MQNITVNPIQAWAFFGLLLLRGGGGGTDSSPLPPLLREYKSYHNETFRVGSRSKNVSFDVHIMR